MKTSTYKVHAPIVRVTDNREVTCPAWMVKASTMLRHILESIADEFYIDPVDIMSGNNTDEVADARQVAYWVLRSTTRLTSDQIAKRMNRRDHTTVLHGIAKVEERRNANPDYRAITDTVLARSEAAKLPVVLRVAA